jgi:hypothetical protein
MADELGGRDFDEPRVNKHRISKKGKIMKVLRVGIMGMVSGLLVGAANADELSDRYIAACVSVGDSAAICTCSAGAMQATFDEAQFSQIVSALEAGGRDAASDTMDAILNVNPALIPVFKSEIAACG